MDVEILRKVLDALVGYSVNVIKDSCGCCGTLSHIHYPDDDDTIYFVDEHWVFQASEVQSIKIGLSVYAEITL